MTPEEKVAMLKKAGVWDVIGFPSCIDKLFDLAAAHEREECAKVCEELINEETCYIWIPDARGAVNNCAAAIRARGEK